MILLLSKVLNNVKQDHEEESKLVCMCMAQMGGVWYFS